MLPFSVATLPNCSACFARFVAQHFWQSSLYRCVALGGKGPGSTSPLALCDLRKRGRDEAMFCSAGFSLRRTKAEAFATHFRYGPSGPTRIWAHDSGSSSRLRTSALRLRHQPIGDGDIGRETTRQFLASNPIAPSPMGSQAAYVMASEATIEREFGALEAIGDSYPKYVISMDPIVASRNGIIHMKLIDFLSGESLLLLG